MSWTAGRGPATISPSQSNSSPRCRRAILPAKPQLLAEMSHAPSTDVAICRLGHEDPFHGLNPQESARTHRHQRGDALREAAANRTSRNTYKYP
jgi:hypothetical protein